MNQLEICVETLDCGYGMGAGYSTGSSRGAAHSSSKRLTSTLNMVNDVDGRDEPIRGIITGTARADGYESDVSGAGKVGLTSSVGVQDRSQVRGPTPPPNVGQ